jgi:hypothetical protein
VPNFEVFTRRMVPLVKAPYVTIQRRGTMSFNKAAHAAMGEPQAVELLFDAGEQIIGVHPVEPATEHAYPIRATSGNQEKGPFLVAGTAFTKYYKIDTSVSKRWVGVMADGVLCIDLKQDGTVVTSNRSGRGSREDSTAAGG